MKVIVAGYPKTGTKSLNEALTSLGYNVYDYYENNVGLYQEYKKILHDGWTTDDFRKMYQDVDATVDMPACYFWEEIHKAFPDSKIILSVRENEDIWFESERNQIEVSDYNIWLRLKEILSPTLRRVITDVAEPSEALILGVMDRPLWRMKTKLNEQMMKLKYRAHNAYVMQNAPVDKLLVYKCSDGWEPLCKFLGLPIPDRPFPHKNKKGNVIEEERKKNEIVKRVEKEMMVFSVLYLSSFTIGAYYVYKIGPISIYDSISNGFLCILDKITETFSGRK